jgi:hypothetical protein
VAINGCTDMGDHHMSLHRTARAIVGACLLATATLAGVPVHAAASDYRFEIVEVKPAGPGKAT